MQILDQYGNLKLTHVGNRMGGLTAGGLVFGGARGLVTQDPALTWDNTNKRLIIGNPAGLPSLSGGNFIALVSDAVSNAASIFETGYGVSPTLTARRANGAIGAPAALNAGDIIFRVSGRGHDGTAFASGSRAYVDIVADENYTSGAQGTRLDFSTTPNGSTTAVVVVQMVGKNLVFPTTAQRIQGNWSDATHANRALFQTSTANNNTMLGAMPNGTGVQSGFNFYNGIDPDNAAFGQIFCNASSFTLQAQKLGTGSYLPFTLNTGGSQRMQVATDGAVTLGQNMTAQFPLQVQISDSTHATSRRAALGIGTEWYWMQDTAGSGVKDLMLYQSSTASLRIHVYTGGEVGIGAAAVSHARLGVFGTDSNAAGNVYGVRVIPTINNTTTTGMALYARVDTSAVSFTLGTAYGVYVANSGKGAGSTITTAVGLLIEDITSGVNNWSVWSAGGTMYHAGDVLIGTTTAAATNYALRVAGGIQPNVDITSDLGSSALRWNSLYAHFALIKNYATGGVGNPSSVIGMVADHSGTPAAGFGVRFYADAKSNGSSQRELGFHQFTWTDPADATRKAKYTLVVYDTAARTAFEAGADGSASTIGFHASTPIAKPTVTGSRGGNAALASLLTQLASYGLITDSTTA